jgi:pyrimidine-nucleoside phosphorylase
MMRIQDTIAAQRDGNELAPEDISQIVLDYTSGRIPDYQMSAFLMAVYIRGLSYANTSALTRAMVESGRTIDLSSISGTKVDKHSTGGVGDKTTLVVVPLLAACGLKVPKMSGRGLGFTGGTLDKLESIPGFNTALSIDRFTRQVRDIGAAIAGQTSDIVPADKKIYALRDVTATVGSIPLIAASVMSKKIACSSDVIVLDVKVGSGAFMRDIDQARELARTMIAIGRDFDRRVAAVITDMSQPLGDAVGNALEAAEAIETLKGGGPEDLKSLCIKLSAIILYIAGHCRSAEEGKATAVDALASGMALDKFTQIVEAQGGNARTVSDPSLLPRAKIKHEVASESSGWVEEIDTAGVGIAASILGAGREKKEDSIDPAVGLLVHKKLGDAVENGESIATLFANDPETVSAAASRLIGSYNVGDRPDVPPLVREVVRS